MVDQGAETQGPRQKQKGQDAAGGRGGGSGVTADQTSVVGVMLIVLAGAERER